MTVMGKCWAFKFVVFKLLTEKRASVTDVPVWFLFYKMQILPFNSFMLWAILFAIKLYYSLHSFCNFERFLFCLSALSHIASLFCFCFFSPLCFCSVKLPEKQFYSMNIKPLLEDSINLFQYLQHLCLFYEHCVRACVCVFVCLSL